MIRKLIAALVAVLGAVLGLTGAGHAQQVWPGYYPEGPVWIGGDLYWAEMQADTVFHLTPEGPRAWFQKTGCGPTALARYGAGDILVLCHLSGSLIHLAADATVIDVIDRASDGTALRNPNDASADGNGGVWFTDPGMFWAEAPAEGVLYYLGQDGTLTAQADALAYGNGVHVDRAGGRLLLSEHLARRVLSYPLEGGALGAPETLVDLNSLGLAKPRYPEAGPDGLEIAPDGTLWIAEYGTKRLLGWRADRGLVAALEVDAPYITNIAFGPDGNAVITGAYTNTDIRNRGGIWYFPAQLLIDAAKPD